MADLTAFYKTRVLYDLTGYEEIDFTERVILCVPKFAWQMARNLMRGYGLRINAYAETYSDAGYYPPGPVLFDKIDESVSDFLAERDMCNELTAAINNLALAFEAGCCGNGSFGAGQEEPPASSQPDEEGDFPAGFDTYAEYREYKCDIANRIVEGIREDMVWLAAGTLTTLVATGLVASLFTPIPFDDILLLVGFVISLLLQGVLTGTATAVADDIETERQALVCILYDATTASAAKEYVLAYMSTFLTSIEQALFASVWTYAAVNALFEKTILLDASPLPDAVGCDGCTSECESCIATGGNEDDNGVFNIVSPTVTDVTSAEVTGTHWAICDFNSDPVTPFQFCGPSVEVDTYSLVGFTPWATQAYRVYNSALSIIYNSSTPPDWSLLTDVRRIQLKSTTSFTGTITLV